ncbi:MAG: 50S ribosomal protein L22 [Flavobacteriales bacterium]
MSVKKRERAETAKEQRKNLFVARLKNCPTSPRKMRLVADLVRGLDVEEASRVLQFSKKESARRLQKLLGSALFNYQEKTGEKWEQSNLFVKEIFVDQSRTLKRLRPAPRGRAFRIRKRSNHVTIILDRYEEESE